MTWEETADLAERALEDARRADRLVAEGAFRGATRADVERILGSFAVARRLAVEPVRQRELPVAWRLRGALR